MNHNTVTISKQFRLVNSWENRTPILQDPGAMPCLYPTIVTIIVIILIH